MENNNTNNNTKVPFYAWVNDPSSNFLLKTKADAKENCTVLYCSCYESCEAYKLGQCALKETLGWGRGICPYGSRTFEEGYTKKSKKYSEWLMEHREKYKNITVPNVPYLNPITRKIINLGKDKVYINLPHLSNYVNSIYEELGMDNAYVAPKSAVTPEFLKKLIEFRPVALMGGEIKSYQEKEVPDFVRCLKRYYPDWYNGLKAIKPDVEQYVVDIDYRGREAYLTSLLPGKVCLKYKETPVEWDGKQLKCPGKLFSISSLEDTEITVTPKEGTVVVICDNNTVDETKIRLLRD